MGTEGRPEVRFVVAAGIWFLMGVVIVLGPLGGARLAGVTRTLQGMDVAMIAPAGLQPVLDDGVFRAGALESAAPVPAPAARPVVAAQSSAPASPAPPASAIVTAVLWAMKPQAAPTAQAKVVRGGTRDEDRHGDDRDRHEHGDD